jgi:hypothetical protein
MIDFKTHTNMTIWKNQLEISVIRVFLDVPSARLNQILNR